jgi:hypothetical protein
MFKFRDKEDICLLIKAKNISNQDNWQKYTLYKVISKESCGYG